MILIVQLVFNTTNWTILMMTDILVYNQNILDYLDGSHNII